MACKRLRDIGLLLLCCKMGGRQQKENKRNTNDVHAGAPGKKVQVLNYNLSLTDTRGLRAVYGSGVLSLKA